MTTTQTIQELDQLAYEHAKASQLASDNTTDQLARLKASLEAVHEWVRVLHQMDDMIGDATPDDQVIGSEARTLSRERLDWRFRLGFGTVLVDLVVLSRLMGTTLWDARQGLNQPDIPGIMPFLQNQPMTWENRMLWLSCLAGSLAHGGITAPKHLGALIACVEDAGRIYTGANMERLIGAVLEAEQAKE